ncbi:hypothetical protein METBIDRAFT_42023 [Metschnikowia bicuspidata var. bicuspidata NRRL YB-4993]|uniref:Uncharacterized protein n=1 Tax=Metschnikowia bicuspidata var. bicuspidata NRRL YB-4993 TaxID=869754 RepID=A0A1A0HB90_9ASCO|nr:hypothetical protein METBIDRAFT_42023 [Metschnikowia bicuspidata var. bicuspidata NRRL YB-4993]OBA21158.1 hypothetical protein METBIDRAFT_42023 [Metschnikowia bicuspidata var. bicuspidata NRRL YB-4993]
MDKASQLLNDAVEAAVMRYVGGTLDTGEELHGAGAPHAEAPEEEELLRKRLRLNPEDLLSEYQWDRFLEEEVAAGFERTTPKKRQRKDYGDHNDIDPNLDGLDGHSEHDQLVHAAILGAGELAKQLASPGPSHHRLPPPIGAHQDRRGGGRHDEQNSTAINHLAHAATALSAGYRRDRREAKRPLKKHTAVAPEQSEPALSAESKYNASSLETLITQASSEACLWYNTQSDAGGRGPRVFSEQEINIVKHFLRGYCRLNHLSRMDICRRVWTSERPKDNFWESVTKVLPYRSKASVYKHVRRQYHVFLVRAIWTPEEDELLRKLTENASTNWKDIGEAMNRMPEDCRDRWRNYIKCGANRVMNKWSEDEEQSLKNIVMEMITNESQTDKPILINWTVVSERMNGVRSRIQCRYKWNKLLRRESISRISMMDNSIKLWMLNRILESNVTDQESIDWDYIVHMYHETHKDKSKILWTTADFKLAFEKMRATIREYKEAPLQAAVAKLVRKLYQTTLNSDSHVSPMPQNAPEPISSYDELRPKPFDASRNAENEAALVANAAVAAVSSRVSEQDAQQQEYSLWR